MTNLQRFCPTCNQSFSEGEAILRCKGCGVFQHPACWVRVGGCVTDRPHETDSEPLAYSRLNPPPPPRLSPADAPAPAQPIAIEARRRPEPPPAARPAQHGQSTRMPADPVIGQRRPAPQRETPIRTIPVPPPQHTGRGSAPPRKPNPGQLGAQTPGLPRLYDRHRILRFWYLPLAVMLAAAVALGVVWTADRLFGDEQQAAAPAPTPTPTVDAAGEPTRPGTSPTPPTPTPAATATPGTAVPPGDRKFAPGDAAVVVGSAPQCLNVRSEAGVENPAIDCIADGTAVTILGGPLEAGGFLWWRIDAPNVIGWAAEDYLEPSSAPPAGPTATPAD
ncbi:MAG: hypothetical protein Kow0010_23420 [Dehalococcoidia bacterium]